MSDTVQSYSAMLRRALGGRLAQSALTFQDMVAPEGVVEFAFAPSGFASRLVGRDALIAHLQRVGGRIKFDRMSEPVIHETADREVLIIEFEGFGHGLATGEPYDQRYICVIRTRGGYIIHITEYWNPLALLRTLKGSKAVEEISAGVWPD